MKKLTQKELKEILNYNSDTGVFVWISSPSKRINLGQIAGTTDKNSGGYRRIMIKGKIYYAHRLAWLYIYGYFPENEIDHKNRIKGDNRIKNLREVSRQCNAKNCKIYSTNTSGVIGVSWSQCESKWVVSIGVSGESKSLGSFINFIDAVYARWKVEKKYKFPDCSTTSSAFNYLTETI